MSKHTDDVELSLLVIKVQKLLNLLPPYSQNGTDPSFCAKYGGLNEYLYSNFLCTVLALNVEINENTRKTASHLTSAAIFIFD